MTNTRNTITTANIPEQKEFNPFIHGTNSAIFALLPSTEFNFVSPMEMIHQYQIAPFGGEINSGDELGTLGTLTGGMKMHFGELSTGPRFSIYTLDEVIVHHASSSTPHPLTTKKLKQKIIAYIKKEGSLYSDIKAFLVNVVRANQLGICVKDLVTADELATFKKNRQNALQFHYLILLLCKYIRVDDDLLKASPEIIRAFKITNSNKEILHLLMTSAIDTKYIYENPTPENLAKIEDLLALPDKTKIFKAGEINLGTEGSPEIVDYFIRMQLEQRNKTFPMFLNSLMHKGFNQEFIDKLHQRLLGMIEIFVDTHQLVDSYIEGVKNKIIPKEDLHWINNPFPVILLSQNQKKITVLNKDRSEYIASEPIHLSTDINMIATKSNSDKKSVLQFLGRHRFFHVPVVTFQQLKDCKGEQPVLNDDNYPKQSQDVGLFKRIINAFTQDEQKPNTSSHLPDLAR